jgi:hypothetical protein
MKNRIVFLILAAFLAVGCHAQLPPSPGYNTTWTVTIPSPSNGWLGCGTGQPTCTLVISTLVVPSGTTTCPASTGSNYVPQQTATTGVAAPTWVQANTTGTSQCAVAQLVQTQAGQTLPSISAASPPSNAVVSPALPLAPNVSGSTQVAGIEKPKMPMLEPSPTESAKLVLQISGVSSR